MLPSGDSGILIDPLEISLLSSIMIEDSSSIIPPRSSDGGMDYGIYSIGKLDALGFCATCTVYSLVYLC